MIIVTILVGFNGCFPLQKPCMKAVHRQEEYISFPSKENETFIGSLVQAEYDVLGGIANSSPFRPDTGGEGLFYFIGNFVEMISTRQFDTGGML